MAKKRKKRRRRGGLGRLLRPLSFILAAVAVVTALTLFFKVQNIEVTGTSRYRPDDIIAASGVETGDNLVLLDRYRVSQRIYTALPYVTEVRPKPKFPDTLEIEITETRAVAAIQGGGGFWLLSAEGKILEAVDSQAAGSYLQLNGVWAVEPAVSSMLVLPEESPIPAERLLTLLEALLEQDALNRTTTVNCSDPRELILEYDGRFRVEMFYDADFDFKVACMVSAADKLEPNQTGTLRMTMTDDYEVRFIPSTG